MKYFNTLFCYIFVSSIFTFNTIKPAMFTELARRQVRSAYEWARKKFFTQPEQSAPPISIPIASTKKQTEPIDLQTIPHYDVSVFIKQVTQKSDKEKKESQEE